MSELTFTRGRPVNPMPINGGCVIWRDCPDCKGRGWYLINPFATGGSNLCGGPSNICQCQTCENAKKYFDSTGEIIQLSDYEQPLFEPIRKPDLHVRESKKHIPRKDEAVIKIRRNRKQKAGRVQSGVKWIPGYRQAQDITEPAFTKPTHE